MDRPTVRRLVERLAEARPDPFQGMDARSVWLRTMDAEERSAKRTGESVEELRRDAHLTLAPELTYGDFVRQYIVGDDA